MNIEKDCIIQTENLCKNYKEKQVLDNVNLHIRKGTIYGLIGRNGAGKTTIMKCLLNLISKTSGKICIKGKEVLPKEKEIYSKIGAIIEAPGFYHNLTGTENLNIFAELRKIKDKGSVEKALNVVGLPYNDKKLFSEYSLGMKQRLGLANAILHNPDILILDEPINGLDPIGIAEVREYIYKLSREYGKTILISSHILSEFDLIADDIGIINEGKLLTEDSIENLNKKNSQYVTFRVSSVIKLEKILKEKYNITNYKIENENIIKILETGLNLPQINKSIIENGIDLYEVKNINETLEEYFKELIGGGDIV